VDYARLLICLYLPERLIPDDLLDADFDELFRLVGMAQVAREMRIEDIEVGVNKGYVEAHPDPQG
jgi:hypothetical protein